MNLRFPAAACTLLLAMISATSVDAGWHEFHQRCMLDWHRSHVWPQPWVYADRLATCQVFDIMAVNGWCQQSTLANDHFHPVTQELTESGRMKVREILVQHPPAFRTLFVVMGNDEQQTASRLDSVQQSAGQIVANGALPEIRRVAIPPRGWPAEDINAIGMKRLKTIPEPRLPENVQSTTQ